MKASLNQCLDISPIEVGKELGNIRIFWRNHHKVKFLVVQDSNGIEHEISKDDLENLDIENPCLNIRFIEELVKTLKGKNKKEQTDLKKNVCRWLNVQIKTLNKAINRYRNHNKDSVLAIRIKNKTKICMESQNIGFGSLDNEEDFSYIRDLVNNLWSVPSKYRETKIKITYATIGVHFKNDLEKWINVFDSEYERQNRKRKMEQFT